VAIRAILADLRAESTHNPAGVTQPGRA
jgi:hypothetical protein